MRGPLLRVSKGGAPLLALFEKWGFSRSVSYLSFVWAVVNDAAIAQAEGVGGPASHVSKTAKLGAPRSSSADGNNSVRYLPAEMWAARQASSTTRLKRWPGGKGIDPQIVVSE